MTTESPYEITPEDAAILRRPGLELTSQRAHVAISMVDSDTKDAALMVRRESAKDRAVVASIVSSVTDRIKATFDLDIATSLPTKWDRPAVY